MTEIIREIQTKDRSACLEIIQSCLLNINSRNYTPEFITSLIKRYNINFMRSLERSIFVIEKNGILVGTGSIIIGQKRINDIFIEVDNHRKGFGKKIMVYLESIAKENNVQTLFLYSSISAVSFYEKLGYAKTDKLDHGEGNIEFRMEKKLL